jgi:hypothetical protein
MHGAVDFDDAARRRSGQHFGIAVEDLLVVVADDAQADQVAGRAHSVSSKPPSTIRPDCPVR